MTINASTGGRRLTLDPVMDREPVPLEVRRVESSLPAGLRVGWMDGKDPETGTEIDLTCGAGVGSPWVILTITKADGTEITEIANMVEFAQQWARAALAAGPTPKVGDTATSDG